MRWRTRRTRYGARSVRASVALLAGAATVLYLAPPASALLRDFTGVGSVKCSFAALLRFSPPLTQAGGGSRPSAIRTSLSGCSGDGNTAGLGKLVGSFASSPLQCAGLRATNAPLSGSIRWSKYSRLLPSQLSSGTASGSFAGTSSVTLDVPPTLAAGCSSPRGLNRTVVTGTIAIGASCATSTVGQPGQTGQPVAIYSLGTGAVCGVSGYDPLSIAVGPDGAMWFGGSSIGRVSTSGLLLDDWSSVGATSITAGPDGAMWFTFEAPGAVCKDDASGFVVCTNGSIGRISVTGSVTTYPLPGNGAPTSITAGPDGALWFVIDDPGLIGRITTDGVLTEYALPDHSFPFTITTGPDGALWFPDTVQQTPLSPEQNFVGRITTSGATTFDSVPYSGSGYGITTGPDGALWITSTAAGGCLPNPGSSGCTWSDFVARMTTGGTFSFYAVPEALYTGPENITPGPDGALWFTNYGPHPWIGRITTSGTVSQYTDPGIYSPMGITAGPDGGVWFSNRNDSLGRITPP